MVCCPTGDVESMQGNGYHIYRGGRASAAGNVLNATAVAASRGITAARLVVRLQQANQHLVELYRKQEINEITRNCLLRAGASIHEPESGKELIHSCMIDRIGWTVEADLRKRIPNKEYLTSQGKHAV